MMFKRFNPLKIMINWLLFLCVVGVIVTPILFATTVGGEQKPLTFLAYLMLTAIYSTFFLSIVTAIIYFDWFKKYWFINLIFFLVSGYYVIRDLKLQQNTEYSFKENTYNIGSSEIRVVREYYSIEPEKLRSEKYWKNNKRDSIWVVYAENGSILKKELYSDDKLLKVIR